MDNAFFLMFVPFIHSFFYVHNFNKRISSEWYVWMWSLNSTAATAAAAATSIATLTFHIQFVERFICRWRKRGTDNVHVERRRKQPTQIVTHVNIAFGLKLQEFHLWRCLPLSCRNEWTNDRSKQQFQVCFQATIFGHWKVRFLLSVPIISACVCVGTFEQCYGLKIWLNGNSHVCVLSAWLGELLSR